MAIAVLVLVLIAFGYAMAAFPEARLPGLVLAAVAALGLGLYFWRSEPAVDRIAIPPDALAFDSVALERTARGATLTGRVRNGSEAFRLREMTIALRLHDCPAPATPVPDCPVIGEARAIARPDTPPGQIRAFSAHHVFANLPDVAGTLRYAWEVEATRATD